MTDKQMVWEKAESLRGCLAHLRTTEYRRRQGEDTEMGNGFINDEAALLQSKAWRTLAKKTQVFTFAKNAFVRTRQAHVLEVVGNSVLTAKALGLNTELTRAAAIGHDIGHVPFGHQGEKWMAGAMGRKEFCHEYMGAIIAQKIERRGHGLNLAHETLEGMICHSGNKAKLSMTPEAWVLRWVDKFTYIFHDINDIMIRMHHPLPAELLALAKEFGDNQRRRTRTAIASLVVESAEMGHVSFEHSELAVKFAKLRDMMYEVYPCVTTQDVSPLMEPVLEFLTRLHPKHGFLLLALATDDEAIMFANAHIRDRQLFNGTALSEIEPYLEEIGEIDLCDPGLDW